MRAEHRLGMERRHRVGRSRPYARVRQLFAGETWDLPCPAGTLRLDGARLGVGSSDAGILVGTLPPGASLAQGVGPGGPTTVSPDFEPGGVGGAASRTQDGPGTSQEHPGA